MRPPVELHRPTILNIAAITCYCLATMFHIIAYATDNWSSLHLGGVKWNMGLWRGCMENGSKTICTDEVFDDKVFKTGSDWHVGSRVMMTLALVLLFFLEFAIIGYACIKNLERHRSRLVGIVIALSISAAFCQFLTLIMYGSEVGKVEDSSVKGSFGIVVISLILEIAIAVLIKIDQHMRKESDNVFIVSAEPQRKGHSTKEKTSALNSVFTIEDYSAGSHVPPVTMRTSVSSLSEAETFRKFAFAEDPAISEGSVGSLLTRDTEFTNVSFTHDRESIESAV